MRRTVAVGIVIVFIVSLTAILGAPGRSLAQSTDVTSKSIGKVYVTKSSYVEFLDPHLTQWGKNNVLTFKIRLFNGGQSVIDLLRYGITVSTAAGGSSNALRQQDEGGTTKVLPQAGKDYVFYAVVPNTAALEGIRLGVKEWNIDYPGFSKTTGSVKIPAGYADTVPAGSARLSQMQGNQVRLSAAEFYTYETAGEEIYTVTFAAESRGNQPVKLPEYSFWLQAGSGELYPLEAGTDNKDELNPKAKRVYDLHASLPKTARSSSFKLLAGAKEEEMNLITDVFALLPAKAWNKLAAVNQKAYYIRPDEAQLSIAAEPLYFAESDLPQMKAGTEIVLKNIGKQAIKAPVLGYFLEIDGLYYPLSLEGSGPPATMGALEQLTAVVSADIPKSLKSRSMRLMVTKSLGNSDDPVYRPLLKLPLEKSEDAEHAKTLTIAKSATKDGTPYTLNLGNVMGYTEGGTRVIQGTLTFANTGVNSIKLPEFRVMGITGQKYKYEGKLAEGEGDGRLSPQATMRRVIKIEVPLNVNLTGFQIVIEEPIRQEGGELYRSVANFTLPDLENTQLAGSGWVYFSNGSGDFKIRRTSTLRLPANGKDALVSEFELYSGGYAAVPLPEFQATYYIDGAAVKAEAFVLDKVLGASPDRPVSVQVVATIPYSTAGGEMTVLLGRSEDNQNSNVAQFAIPKADSLKSYREGDTYTLDITGGESEIQLYQVLVYPGAAEDMIEIELVQRNLNKRSTVSNPLTGYLETADGMYYPLEYESGSGAAIKYGGAAIQTLSGKVPKGTRPETLKLLLGVPVNGNGIVESGARAEAYVKPAIYSLMEERKSGNNGLANLNAGPYSLTLSNVAAKWTSTYSGAIEFNARLFRDTAFDDFDGKHKIVIRVENGGEVITQREFGLNTDDDNSFTLTNGKFQVDGISTGNAGPLVQFKVYLSYKGGLKLLSTQTAALPAAP
ncbi:hypothetical protein [Paenibacillus sp. FSL R5-0912]|uniref:hypothetical protein n=1 Tax=Paenibacillus sp. FSL R5-0912 TaxID=1536771 RepID=UPI0004F68514|nr:hypothetical protein [Paenibacillus sp. FSL R5-0912]AIQ42211.1 hypothetical protein R50912_20800 [Paenibacillus sp. FSL R5-0912]